MLAFLPKRADTSKSRRKITMKIRTMKKEKEDAKAIWRLKFNLPSMNQKGGPTKEVPTRAILWTKS